MAIAWTEGIDLDEEGRLAEAMADVRKGLEAAWTQRSRKDAETWLAARVGDRPWLGYEVREGTAYLMEGECGRWSFTTHEVVDCESGRVLCSTRRRMPELRGEARCRTGAFKSLAVFLGAKTGSFRLAAGLLSHLWRQGGAKVSASTLRDMSEREGAAIGEALAAETEEILKGCQDGSGIRPRAGSSPVEGALASAIAKADIPQELRAEAQGNPVPFTAPESTLELSPDAVFCKLQKAHRKHATETKGRERKTVSTCCASIALQNGMRLVLATADYKSLAKSSLASIVANKLQSLDCCLLSDGERKIGEEFLPVLSGKVANLHQILDWHHLHLRCAQLLSLALRGKEIRNAHLNALMRLLWHGCADSAMELAGAIPKERIKSPRHLQELGEYLARRKPQIPVYSVRKALGLPNSSNRVEKTNDRLVSRRQKGLGMSWSQDGSLALASLRMVSVNYQEHLWIKTRGVSLEMARRAA